MPPAASQAHKEGARHTGLTHLSSHSPQQHEVLLPSGQRAGFLIGDGAGVGKGRTVAGIIVENYLRGRKKALW